MNYDVCSTAQKQNKPKRQQNVKGKGQKQSKYNKNTKEYPKDNRYYRESKSKSKLSHPLF